MATKVWLAVESWTVGSQGCLFSVDAACLGLFSPPLSICLAGMIVSCVRRMHRACSYSGWVFSRGSFGS